MISQNLETKTSNPPIPTIQIAYNPEWAIKKFFGAIRDKEINRKFQLFAVCGVEKNSKKAMENLERGIINNGNSEVEKENAKSLKQNLESGEIRYYQVNGKCSLPTELHQSKAQVVIIHSKNTTHLNYIRDAVLNGKHVLCEKPLVPVLDKEGKATDKYLRQLELIVESVGESILMDAEHYSNKKASIIFYQNLKEILKQRKIRLVQGELLEVDNPYKWRTLDVLSRENQTGLLGDTMVHLLSFISNLQGRAIPIRREFSCFKDDKVEYGVDTYNEVQYKIENTGKAVFTKDAQAHLKVGKFINLAGREESKKITFFLDDNSEIGLDLKAETVVRKKDGEAKDYQQKSPISSNEYINLLNQLNFSIFNHSPPLTHFKNSILTLRAIYESYKIGEKTKVYN